MDLWQRSSLLPPSASLGSRHDDAAATLGQPRFLHGDPRGSQGGEGQLRQPPPAPPGDLETVRSALGLGTPPSGSLTAGLVSPRAVQSDLPQVHAGQVVAGPPGPRAKTHPLSGSGTAFPRRPQWSHGLRPCPARWGRPPHPGAASAQWRGRRPVAAGGAPLNPVAAGGAPLNRGPAPAHRAGLHLGVQE